MNIADIWYEKFLNVAQILKNFYGKVLTSLKSTDSSFANFLEFATKAEETQSYPWVYIDYGFRTPIYRTMQWLSFNIPDDIWENVKELIQKSLDFKSVINEYFQQLRKEYLFVWAKILDTIGEEKSIRILNDVIKDVLKLDKEPREVDPDAFKDVKGISSELKAGYVLIDHNKPFLPFSIMQAPMTPSPIIPSQASGDLYLFEENLVVDVKGGGWLDSKTKLPTYYWGNKKNLSYHLKGCSNLHGLYGIRKGIGVVVEEKEVFHFAVYVPWRSWTYQGPLLYLKSPKLPLLVYMHRVSSEGGIEPYHMEVRNNIIRITIDAFLINKSINVNGLTIKMIKRKQDKKLKFEEVEIEENKYTLNIESEEQNNKLTIKAEIDLSKDNIENYIRNKLALIKIAIPYNKYEIRSIEYPILAIVKQQHKSS